MALSKEEQERKEYEEYLAYVRGLDQPQPLDWGKTARGNVEEVGNLVKGFTGEAKLLGRKATNLMLPKSMEPSWATDEAIKKAESEFNPVNAGSWGAFGADYALTGGAAGALERGLAAAGMKLLPRALGATEATLGRGRKVLEGAGRVGRAATSGAAQGVVLASPDERPVWGATGAGAGALLSSLGEGGAVLRKAWDKAKISDKAKQLLASLKSVDKNAFIPVNQAAEPGVLSAAYRGWVGNMPGVGHVIRKQSEEAMDAARLKAMENALPEDVILDHVWQPGDDFQKGVKELRTKWKEAFEPINSRRYNMPDNTVDENLLSYLRDLGLDAPGLVPSKTGFHDVSGEQLTMLRTHLTQLKSDPKITSQVGDLGAGVIKQIDDNINKIDAVIQGGTPADVFEKWRKNLERYKPFQDLERTIATEAPGNAKFSMQGLSNTASRRAGDAGIVGEGGPQQELGNLASEVLGGSQPKPNIFQMSAAVGAGAGLTEGAQRVLGINEDSPGMRAGVDLATPFAVAALLSNRRVQGKLLHGGSGVSPMTKALMRWSRRGAAPALYQMTNDNEEDY